MSNVPLIANSQHYQSIDSGVLLTSQKCCPDPALTQSSNEPSTTEQSLDFCRRWKCGVYCYFGFTFFSDMQSSGKKRSDAAAAL